MALIAFASAKGSPGVSVTVAGLAHVWPNRAVVADLDPAGGDTGLRYRTDDGDPLDPSTGLLSLGAAVRSGQSAALEDHLQTTAGGMRTLVGVNTPGQVLGLGPAWQHIALTLRRTADHDVLADCGRLTPGSPAMAIIDQADAVVLVSRGELEDIAHLRERLRGLQGSLHLGSIDATPTGIAMVAPANDSRGLADAEQLMASAGLPVRGLGIIAHDPRAADVLRTESGRNIRRSVLVRSLVDLSARIHELTTLTGRIRQNARQGELMDQQLLRDLRTEVADSLSAQRRDDESNGLPTMSSEDERQFARAVIARVLEGHAAREIAAGRTPPTVTEEGELAEGIHAALYGVGRLQPLLDDPEVENIDINGFDNVFVGYANGEEKRFPPVAESDEELVELVQVLGAYSSITSRPFDTANPQLDLRLPDGSRLSAVMGVCQRPSLSIRRARIQRASLDMLVENGSMSHELAGFLSAAVAARKNIMIAGATNAGKTTLLRALANEIAPVERLVTVERALELGLGEFADLHPNVVAFEERLPNSEGQGAIAMSELVRRSLRMNPSRVIVGEVLGDEIVTMLNAMSQGNDGSLSTIHANSSLEVFNRICTYAIQSAERLPSDATMMLIAGAIDFVIFVERRNEYASGGGLRRLVTSVREVNGVDGRVLSSEIFAEGPDGVALPAAPIQCLDELLEVGYQPDRGRISA